MATFSQDNEIEEEIFSPPPSQMLPATNCNISKSENRKKVMKRKDPLSWDDYFMSVAFLSSMRSKDPSTQVGACIVNEEKRIVGKLVADGLINS
jgi:hypothetical protein